MAILQSIDGRFYQVPEEEAEKFLVPADKVEETLRAAGATQPQAAAPAAGCAPTGRPMNAGAPSVVIICGGGGGGAPQGMPMGGPQQQQPMGACQQGQQQVQAYAHHGGHGGHHGGHWGHGWGGFYSNYYNYSNYSNYYGW